ncbi:hypothetical protein V6N12_004315 [Hibiscus sabdariffa]|uniref:Pentatricopeptide repeat-containing protein n=1 Tax=Hibiscus sabdariffa TaxID=183260 RepID=A0ABR2CLF1_9ROSI
MTLSSLTNRLSRVRAASKAFIPRCRFQFHGLSQGAKAIQKQESWFVKVVCTLFVYSQPLDDSSLGYLIKNLTPSTEFEVVKWLNNPAYGLKFFELSRENLDITHSFWTYNLLIRSFCHVGLHGSAKLVFDYMKIDGHLPDSTLLGFMISAFGRAGEFDLARKLLAEVRSDGVMVTVFALNNLLNMMVKQNKLEEAVRPLQSRKSESSF